ncbi:hypothetical protein C1I98_35150 [Spongiactinospora gelatinilytica]|uniref:Uncharacterized protein n=1 Tax=Spongiactinospora gelatinilytica TaxID=2666298 RepID=A0A2W2F9B7_9ACTN|nr:hypothetical protein C1I98_35150 [Spongiactinospora gelatinilytica]
MGFQKPRVPDHPAGREEHDKCRDLLRLGETGFDRVRREICNQCPYYRKSDSTTAMRVLSVVIG